MAFVYPPTTVLVDEIVAIHVGPKSHYFEFYNNSPYNIMLRPDNGGLPRNFNPQDILVPWSAKILNFPLEDDVFSYYVDPSFPVAANPGNHFELQFIADNQPRNPSGIAYSALGLTDSPVAIGVSDVLNNEENPPYVDVVRIKNTLDAETRFYMRNDGSIRWGDGSIAPDLLLEVLQRYYLKNHATLQFAANVSTQPPTPPDIPNTAYWSNNNSSNVWNNFTAESNTVGGTPFDPILTSVNRTVYIGNSVQFDTIEEDLSVNASGGGGAMAPWQYWNGSAWVNLVNQINLDAGNALEFRASGRFKFTLPSDWAQRALTGIGGTPPDTTVRYWIRCPVQAAFTTSAQVLRMRPPVPTAPPPISNPLWEGFDIDGVTRTSYLMPDGSLYFKGGAWTTLIVADLPANWSNSSNSAKYRLNGDYVEMVGNLTKGTGTDTPPVILFTLPVGYRPLNVERIMMGASNTGWVVYQISTNGNVTMVAAQNAPGNARYYLDGLRFPISA